MRSTDLQEHRQPELSLARSPHRVHVPVELIRSKKTKGAAFTLACDTSGLEDKEIGGAMNIDPGTFSRLKNSLRRARLTATESKLSRDIACRLKDLQRGKCACGCKQQLGTDYHLDHIMPLALGGTNTDGNIQLLRATCNLNKAAKHPVDFMQQRGFLL